jgi:acyl-coenzyme A synthetase/AMP-(fatty) acid ligase
MLTPLPGATPTKPGSATNPFFGVDPVLVDDKGNLLQGESEGNLVGTKNSLSPNSVILVLRQSLARNGSHNLG